MWALLSATGEAVASAAVRGVQGKPQASEEEQALKGQLPEVLWPPSLALVTEGCSSGFWALPEARIFWSCLKPRAALSNCWSQGSEAAEHRGLPEVRCVSKAHSVSVCSPPWWPHGGRQDRTGTCYALQFPPSRSIQ